MAWGRAEAGGAGGGLRWAGNSGRSQREDILGNMNEREGGTEDAGERGVEELS